MSEVRFSSQWAMAESGTMAPVVATGVAAAVAPDEVLSTAKGNEVTPEGVPVRVPDPIAATVMDSLFDAAMAAIFVTTGLAPVDEAAGVLVVIDDPVLAAEVLPTDALVAAPTSCPPEVGKAAAAPEGEDAVVAEDASVVAAGAAAGVVDPRSGTEAAAPVVPVLM